jgi:hypothetical protein
MTSATVASNGASRQIGLVCIAVLLLAAFGFGQLAGSLQPQSGTAAGGPNSYSDLLSPIPGGPTVLQRVIGTTVCSAASAENVTARNTDPPSPGVIAVRTLGSLDSAIALRILSEVRTIPFNLLHNSPLLLAAETLNRLDYTQTQEFAATYQAGYTILLLCPNLAQINALHAIIGEGVTYRSKDTGIVLAYALRRENYTPTGTLLTTVDPSPLRTSKGRPDPTGLQDEELAFSNALARAVTDLTHIPQGGVPGLPRNQNQQVDWLSSPTLATTFSINSPQGVYNTPIYVYALYSCIDQTDHYAVTAGADWTATTAQWQGATSEGPSPSMYLDGNGELVINWQSNNRTYCSSPGFAASFDDVCRYINYPLSYGVTMVPRTEGPVTQLNAAPSATQGQETTYTSGFSILINGAVNVSAMGPGGGIFLGARWNNSSQTTVPPLIVDVSNTGNEGVDWDFKYCTTGLEPDPGTNCTSHVQMVKDVCQAQLGDYSGTDPQQGQTPVGKFSNAVQSAHWQASSLTRTGKTFDIEVGFQANTANTIAHLNNDGYPDPIQGCNGFGCACVSVTTPDPVVKSITFQVPFPSTKCQ